MKSLNRINSALATHKPSIKMERIDKVLDAWDTGRGLDRIDETILLLREYKKFIKHLKPLLIYYIDVIETIENKVLKQ